MDQQVSPAVVVIVLILIVAILVGLYFLVVERRPEQGEDMPGDMPMGDVGPPPEAGVDAAIEAGAPEESGVQGGDEESSDQGEADQDSPETAETAPEQASEEATPEEPAEPAGG